MAREPGKRGSRDVRPFPEKRGNTRRKNEAMVHSIFSRSAKVPKYSAAAISTTIGPAATAL